MKTRFLHHFANWPYLRLILPVIGILVLVISNPMDIHGRSKAVSYDWLIRLFPFNADPDVLKQLLFIDIDEASLKTLGQWPWPRQLTAELISTLNTAEPLAIGVDVLMPEPDRFTPDALHGLTGADKAMLASILPDGDAILADTLAKTPSVTGFALLPDHSASQSYDLHHLHTVAHIGAQIGGYEGAQRNAIPYAPGILMNIAALQTASGAGFVSLSLGHDSTVRHIPLLARYDDQILPAMPLEMLRVAQSGHGHVFKAAGTGGNITSSIRTGAIITSTDAAGQFAIHHGYTHNIRRLSASTILLKPPSEWSDLVSHALIVIGSSANGLKDRHNTPLEASIAGSYIHLGTLAQILSDRVIYQSRVLDWLEIAILALASIILTLILHHCHMRWVVIGYISVVVAPALIHAYGFIHLGWLGNPIFDMSCLIIIGGCHITIRAVKEEKRRQKLKSAFNHYLSPSMVRELEIANTPPKLGGERRVLTILFMDIRGFTTLSDQWSDHPEHLTLLINGFMDAMSEIILAHNGTLDKYIGDAIMAFWNAPLDQPDHADKAISCGLEMLAKLPDINIKLKSEIKLPDDLDIGIGIATGMVVVGNMGSRFRFSYSCLGDAVNTAARLEAMVKQTGAKLSVAESTIQAAQSKTGLIKIASLPVRGKSDHVNVYSTAPTSGAKLT